MNTIVRSSHRAENFSPVVFVCHVNPINKYYVARWEPWVGVVFAPAHWFFFQLCGRGFFQLIWFLHKEYTWEATNWEALWLGCFVIVNFCCVAFAHQKWHFMHTHIDDVQVVVIIWWEVQNVVSCCRMPKKPRIGSAPLVYDWFG